MSIIDEVGERVERLELGFNPLGVDRFGVSKSHLKVFLTALGSLYRYYFRVKAYGIENVPGRGRAMLIGNHSGGVAFDGGMVIASMLLEMDPPRLAHAMVEKFLNATPIASQWTARTGQFVGLPENAIQLLEDERLLMVFPEGARGTAKLYKERFSLVDFGTGFMRLALQTKTPIVPFGFIGGGDALPTFHNSRTIGKLVGAPYVPFTPWLLPVPIPAQLSVHYGKPMVFEGTGNEEDSVIFGYVEQVKEAVRAQMEAGRSQR